MGAIPYLIIMKKITSLNEYNELSRIVDEAQDALYGESQIGIHYSLNWILRGYGVIATDRQDVVRQGKNLIEEYERKNF